MLWDVSFNNDREALWGRSECACTKWRSTLIPLQLLALKNGSWFFPLVQCPLFYAAESSPRKLAMILHFHFAGACCLGDTDLLLPFSGLESSLREWTARPRPCDVKPVYCPASETANIKMPHPERGILPSSVMFRDFLESALCLLSDATEDGGHKTTWWWK